jgi:hypothetical protein
MVGGARPQYYISRRPRLHKTNLGQRKTGINFFSACCLVFARFSISYLPPPLVSGGGRPTVRRLRAHRGRKFWIHTPPFPRPDPHRGEFASSRGVSAWFGIAARRLLGRALLSWEGGILGGCGGGGGVVAMLDAGARTWPLASCRRGFHFHLARGRPSTSGLVYTPPCRALPDKGFLPR